MSNRLKFGHRISTFENQSKPVEHVSYYSPQAITPLLNLPETGELEDELGDKSGEGRSIVKLRKGESEVRPDAKPAMEE